MVKFGDTRDTSSNTSNYRGDSDSIGILGNNGDRSLGKRFEQDVLQGLEERGMATRIGSSESYLVKDSTYNTLNNNWQSNTQGNTCQRMLLMPFQINKSTLGMVEKSMAMQKERNIEVNVHKINIPVR